MTTGLTEGCSLLPCEASGEKTSMDKDINSKVKAWLDIEVHTFNLRTFSRQDGLSEFQASLVYIVSYRPARAT